MNRSPLPSSGRVQNLRSKQGMSSHSTHSPCFPQKSNENLRTPEPPANCSLIPVFSRLNLCPLIPYSTYCACGRTKCFPTTPSGSTALKSSAARAAFMSLPSTRPNAIGDAAATDGNTGANADTCMSIASRSRCGLTKSKSSLRAGPFRLLSRDRLLRSRPPA